MYHTSFVDKIFYFMQMNIITGVTYNIPICIYLEKNYPRQSPICFVRPTNYMILKQTKIVNTDGEVNISYLSDWRYVSSNKF